ncbi:MAG: glycosyltransferase family 2 protein [Eubacterium sp.]|nr:glycosyltransferase family 2 protein [Eubacterium sp.]
MKRRILLFIPMYNCEKQIKRVLAQLSNDVCRYIHEVIIVNNRSTDHGEKAVREYLESHQIAVKVRLFRNDSNYGLGGSHKVAFDYAVTHKYGYVIVLHGDDQGNLSDLLPYLKNGSYKKFDCFLGARFMRGSKLQGYSKFRTFGNVVYNILFSIGCGFKIYDLGSGLNMYKTDILKDQFYLKYKDNLVFNYCMVMGSAYYKHKVAFFPIVWKEDDQVSNVKMVRQATTVLRLLASFVLHKKKFMEAEHRSEVIESYSAKIIYENQYSG